MSACGHMSQSVHHVVVDCVTHKASHGFAGLRRLDAATRTCLKELNVDIEMIGKRLYTYAAI